MARRRGEVVQRRHRAHARTGTDESLPVLIGSLGEIAPHRIDIDQAPARARILAGGELIADTTRALLLHETGHAVRVYIPREDVVAPVEPSEKTTFCPFKGTASHWTVAGVENAAWSYEEPKDEVGAIRGRLAFYPDRVTVEIDS